MKSFSILAHDAECIYFKLGIALSQCNMQDASLRAHILLPPQLCKEIDGRGQYIPKMYMRKNSKSS